MDSPSVAQRPIIHPAVCPICGKPALRETPKPVHRDVAESVFLDAADHMWISKWVTV